MEPDTHRLRRPSGFGPVSCPFEGPEAYRVDRAPRPVQLAPGAEFVQNQAVELGPHPGLGPLAEPPEGGDTRQAKCWWQLVPRSRTRHLTTPCARDR